MVATNSNEGDNTENSELRPSTPLSIIINDHFDKQGRHERTISPSKQSLSKVNRGNMLRPKPAQFYHTTPLLKKRRYQEDAPDRDLAKKIDPYPSRPVPPQHHKPAAKEQTSDELDIVLSFEPTEAATPGSTEPLQSSPSIALTPTGAFNHDLTTRLKPLMRGHTQQALAGTFIEHALIDHEFAQPRQHQKSRALRPKIANELEKRYGDMTDPIGFVVGGERFHSVASYMAAITSQFSTEEICNYLSEEQAALATATELMQQRGIYNYAVPEYLVDKELMPSSVLKKFKAAKSLRNNMKNGPMRSLTCRRKMHLKWKDMAFDLIANTLNSTPANRDNNSQTDEALPGAWIATVKLVNNTKTWEKAQGRLVTQIFYRLMRRARHSNTQPYPRTEDFSRAGKEQSPTTNCDLRASKGMNLGS
ncbi:hypothetical protein KEM56_007115 [Ascosphaera pollenicola]|nr:hypothetical protein KEM56_007115 [Ascosphaera pollenicola]